MEGGHFLVMGDDDGVTDGEGSDVIAAIPLRGLGMEELGVLISLFDSAEFAPLFPKGRPLFDGEHKFGTGRPSEILLST
jgi:hypothetical protein